MPTLLHDLRHALRAFRKSPGFAAAATATLALAIGANTAIFSVIRGVLLSPLPFARPDGLVRIEERDQDGNASNTGYPTFLDWRERNRSLSDLTVASLWRPKLGASRGVDAERLEGLRVSDGFFRMLGIRPALGRDFLPAEDRRDANRVVLLSDGLWRRRFGADPNIADKTILLGETPYRVAGVLPPEFASVFSSDPTRPAQIFAPLGYDTTLPQACRSCRHLRALGRLKPGVSSPQALADMTAISEQLLREHPTEYSAAGAFVTPFARVLTDRVRVALWALLAAVGVVLLIGCANVASLLLARAGRRTREVAVRTALGAPRGRIVSLFLAEALLLALVGGGLGVLAAGWTLQGLLALAPPGLPRVSEIRLDGGVLAYAFAVTLATGLLFGLGPALSMSRLPAEPALREASGASSGRGKRRFGGALIVFDVALAVVLVSGALVLAKSASRLLHVAPGFRADDVLTMEIDVSGARYDDAEPLSAFWDRVLERVRAVPGVASAGLVSQLPLGGDYDGYSVHAQDKPSANPESDPGADRYSVSDDYLTTMGIPILRGRGILPADRRGAAPVVLVNTALAARIWPGESPLGKRVQIGGTDGPWREVVGVVGSVRHTALDAPESAQIYLPRAQFVDNTMVLVVRAAHPERLAAAVRTAVASLDPDQPIIRVATMERVVAAAAGTRTFSAGLLAAFAGLAALLAAVGIFGVMAALVGQRTREIATRLALGATRKQIASLVSGRTLRLSALGVAAGLTAWLAIAPLIARELFAVGPLDPASLLIASTLIVAVAVASSLVPARRAMRVDPVTALRSE